MNFLDHYLISETTTVQDLLTDPSNNAKSFKEILNSFIEHGGKKLGEGMFAKVLYHPSWNYVLKIFNEDVAYLRFARFVMQNPRPSFPKFLDKPRKILPNFQRSPNEEYVYFIKMEKLSPVSQQEFRSSMRIFHQELPDKLKKGLANVYAEIKIIGQRKNDSEARAGSEEENAYWTRKLEAATASAKDLQTQINTYDDRLRSLFAEQPHLQQFQTDWNFLLETMMPKDPDVGIDFHNGNVMKRDNGEYVITDPFAGGNLGGSHAAKIKDQRYNTLDKYADAIGLYSPSLIKVPGGKKVNYPAPVPPKKRSQI